ncbi:MAG TPA: hypothetical protein PKC70_11705, partial [Cellvibrionaceae bacterium]|nr:hypothetical protein [Cellvibrionaceae bacterium]
MNRTHAFSLRLFTLITLLLCCASLVRADVNDQLVQKISQAKNELEALEKKTSQESRSYAQRGKHVGHQVEHRRAVG